MVKKTFRSLRMCSLISTEYKNVQTDRRTTYDGTGHADA